MSRSVEVEAIVLRSMRYGEADRILHLYSLERGRIGAIAKGVRKARSRFGGRLEPPARVKLGLHQGRSDLYTVTAVETIAAYPRLRESHRTLDSASRACDAVSRMFGDGEPSPPVYNLLANMLSLLDSAGAEHAGPSTQIAFRLKLLLASGLTPHLSSCASCGAVEGLQGFSGAEGGVVCEDCMDGGFPIGDGVHRLLSDALATPLAQTPQEDDPVTLRLADRVVTVMAEHHGHVRLRSALEDAALAGL